MQLKTYTSTYENNTRATVEAQVDWVWDIERENELVNLYPQILYQKLEGFGGAVTDSAGYVFSLMDEAQKEKLVTEYFGAEGMHYNRVRIPIDSCDFSLAHYEADGEEADENFEHFSFERVEKYILPLLDAAEKAYGGKLDILLSPWSPPVYMKTNGERNNGGKIKPEYRKRWAETIIDEETSPMIAGMAFHWYSGDHFEALQMIREKYPDKKLLLSEACIEYRKFAADDYLTNAQKYAHDMIGNLNHGMNTFYDWNLLLDEVGGPNHVGNFCDAPYLFDTKTKELRETNICGHLWHFIHFLKPEAQRIGVTCYTDKIEVTAFEKDGRITVVLLNRTEEEIPVYLRLGEYCAELTSKAKSIMTAEIEK